MAYQSEYSLENEMMAKLKENGFERITIKNDEQLLANFRAILNERHADKLNGQPLTDKEFQRLLTMINGKGYLKVPVFYVINYCLNVTMNRKYIYHF